ncbi:uncharacterized protein LOC106645138 [Copidosoma floridanum]|uniref:uncharacterized protein LOC106645138 n=1 Tax=Copidosoma floridanum TaxID=29053 RepID=UPI0006C9C4C2|nr:uncharacterized protein LOC106645138 [Copidosoma floridanum]
MVRAWVDQCSQCSIVSDALCTLLKLKRQCLNIPISGSGGTSVGIARSEVEFTISPSFSHLEGLELVDPYYTSMDNIDIILGADVHAQIVEGSVRKGKPNEPIATCTLLGWILSGSMGFKEATSGSAVSLHCAEEDQLILLLKRFWEIEELPADPNSLWTGDEKACEQHFIDTHYRDSTGRYVVRLPFKTDPKPVVKERDAAKTLSITMQKNLERRFHNNSVLFDAYSLFMREYINPNHMVKLKLNETNDCWFLPHHGMKEIYMDDVLSEAHRLSDAVEK